MAHNDISEYWNWLDKIDPRLREIFLALDDEYATGRVGTRQNFEGDMIYRIRKVATDSNDFVTLFTAAFSDMKNVETVALQWWNVTTKIHNDVLQELTELAVKHATTS